MRTNIRFMSLKERLYGYDVTYGMGFANNLLGWHVGEGWFCVEVHT